MPKSIVVPSVIWVISLFLLVSCGKDDNQGPEPISTGDVIAKKTIGSEGGTLEGGNLVVAIPAQMFSAPVELTLSKLKAEAFGNQATGDIVFINKIPASASGVLTISIDMPGTTENLLMMSETPWTSSLGGENLSFHPVDYTMNDGKATVSISLGGYKSGNNLEEETSSFSLGLVAVSGYSSITSTGNHFKIYYPAVYAEGAEKLADYLEASLSILTQVPYSLSVDKRTDWPVNVTICKLKSSVYGYFEASALGDNYASMLFNQEKLNDDANLKATAIHELMHFIQSLYDPRNRFSKAKLEAPTWWLDEAVAVWSEEITASVPSSFISAARKGNEHLPFEGNLGVRPEKPQHFGYGMSAMIRYLVKSEGPASIRNIYEKIAQGSKPADAIREGLGKFYWEWYGAFMAQYSAGEIYSDLTPQVILGGKPESIIFSSAKDTLKAVSEKFNPLQTKFYKIQLNAEVLDDESTLSVGSTNPGYEFYAIYKVKASAMEKISEGGNPTVQKVKDLLNQGYKLLLMVANTQYQSTSTENRTLDFRIQLNKEQAYQEYKSFSFTLVLMTKGSWSGNPTDSTLMQISQQINVNRWFVPLNNGTSYALSWDNVSFNGYVCSGSFTATINSDKTMNFEIQESKFNSTNTLTYSAKGYNIPIEYSGTDGKRWHAGSSYGYIKTYSASQSSGGTNYWGYHGVYPGGGGYVSIAFNTFEY